jgi:hypothetical protein
MPTSFLVKHNAKRRKPLAHRLATYSKQPESYTSRGPTSKLAAEGNMIYVVETRRLGMKVSYWLGYRFASTRREVHPSGKWEGEFKYCNRSDPPTPGNGLYLAEPVLITDHELYLWIRGTQGMMRIPDALVPKLDDLLASSGAKACA